MCVPLVCTIVVTPYRYNLFSVIVSTGTSLPYVSIDYVVKRIVLYTLHSIKLLEKMMYYSCHHNSRKVRYSELYENP